MKRIYGFLSDVFYRLNMQKYAIYFLMKSLEVSHTESVTVNIKMTPPVIKIVHEKPRITFEDKDAIASLNGVEFKDIAIVNNYLDVN